MSISSLSSVFDVFRVIPDLSGIPNTEGSAFEGTVYDLEEKYILIPIPIPDFVIPHIGKRNRKITEPLSALKRIKCILVRLCSANC